MARFCFDVDVKRRGTRNISITAPSFRAAVKRLHEYEQWINDYYELVRRGIESSLDDYDLAPPSMWSRMEVYRIARCPVCGTIFHYFIYCSDKIEKCEECLTLVRMCTVPHKRCESCDQRLLCITAVDAK